MAEIIGTSGDDELVGTVDDDTIYGGAGDDTLSAGAGDDFLYGEDGNDLFYAGTGRDYFDGGNGQDEFLVDARNATFEVDLLRVNLAENWSTTATSAQTPDSDPLYDQLFNIEDYTFFGDWNLDITGSSDKNVLRTDLGNDILRGGAGDDTIDGGAGNDTAVFSGVRSNYSITLQDGVFTVSDNAGSEGTDILTNIENLRFADVELLASEYDTWADDDSTLGANVVENTAGNDNFAGSASLDLVVYTASKNDFTITNSAGVISITNGLETDTLTDFERVTFADGGVAFDIENGNAGKTAKILGAVFGAEAVSNEVYAGIGIDYLDKGTSYEDLMTLAINVAVGADASNAAIVEHLYQKVVGVTPSNSEAQVFVGLLEDGTYTKGSLGVLAAETSLNLANINLTGLAETGLDYLPIA